MLRYIIPETVIPTVPGWSPDRILSFFCLFFPRFVFLASSFLASTSLFSTMLSREQLSTVRLQLREASEARPTVPLPPLGENDTAYEEWASAYAYAAVRVSVLFRAC